MAKRHTQSVESNNGQFSDCLAQLKVGEKFIRELYHFLFTFVLFAVFVIEAADFLVWKIGLR